MKIMLCESIKEEDIKNLNGNWKANIKFDGDRIIAIKKGKDVFLMSRSGNEKSKVFPEVTRELKKSDDDFIIDGEIITTDGLFNSLQKRSNLSKDYLIKEAEIKIPIRYMVFDVLSYNGKNLTNKPLKERINYWDKITFKIVKPINIKVMFCQYEDIKECLDYAKTSHQEGIVIKNMDSIYEGKRSQDWKKLKFFNEGELVVTHYTENNGGIRVEDEYGIAVQVEKDVKKVKEKIDRDGYCEIYIQYLEMTKDNKYRNISYRGIKNG